MKPYLLIPINDYGEPLVPITNDTLAFFDPPPYARLGANYGNKSPWMLRESVAKALFSAQEQLTGIRPGWKIKVFDAYRPNSVQRFMVEREFSLLASLEGIENFRDSDSLRLSNPECYKKLANKVFGLWGIPSDAPTSPPPHSTGAAIDCTLADERGAEIDMGSPIDENSERSMPEYFANLSGPQEKTAHANRTFLNKIMSSNKFHRHKNEWWHFSLGDQMWALQERELHGDNNLFAVYGTAQ